MEYSERFELVVVKDLTKDDTFDETVKGMDAIAHTASYFNAIDSGGRPNSNRTLNAYTMSGSTVQNSSSPLYW